MGAISSVCLPRAKATGVVNGKIPRGDGVINRAWTSWFPVDFCPEPTLRETLAGLFTATNSIKLIGCICTIAIIVVIGYKAAGRHEKVVKLPIETSSELKNKLEAMNAKLDTTNVKIDILVKAKFAARRLPDMDTIPPLDLSFIKDAKLPANASKEENESSDDWLFRTA